MNPQIWPAIAGIAWMFICFLLWWHNVTKAPWFAGRKSKLLILFCPLFDRWGQDWTISLIITIGGTMLQGVTGMLIGMMSSLLVSLILWMIRPWLADKKEMI